MGACVCVCVCDSAWPCRACGVRVYGIMASGVVHGARLVRST